METKHTPTPDDEPFFDRKLYKFMPRTQSEATKENHEKNVSQIKAKNSTAQEILIGDVTTSSKLMCINEIHQRI